MARIAAFFSGVRGRLVLLVLLGALPILIATLHEAVKLRDYAVADAHDETAHVVDRIVAEHQRLLAETRMLLTALSHVPQVRTMGAECNTLLANLRNLDPRYVNYGVIAADGQLRCSGLPFVAPVDFSRRSYFRRAMESHVFTAGDYQMGLLSKQAVLVMALPLLDEAGQSEGVIYASLNLQWLTGLVAGAKLPKGSEVVLLDGDDTVLAHHPEPGIWAGRNVAAEMRARGLILTAERGTLQTRGLDDVERLYGYVRLADIPGAHGIHMVVGLPTVEAFRATDEIVLHLMLVGALAVVLMLLFAWYLGGAMFGRAVEQLHDASQRLAAGELGTRVVPEGVSEVQALGHAFNRMAEELSHQMREVQRLNRVYRVLSGINGALLRLRDRDHLLHEACRIATTAGDFPAVWVALREGGDGALQLVAHAGSAGEIVPAIQQALGDMETASWGEGLLQGQPYVCNDLGQAAGPAWGAAALALGLPAMALFPLRREGKLMGIFALHAREAGMFDRAEMRLLEEMTADTSLGLEMVEKEHDLYYTANYDRVTRLPNRHLFEDRLQQILARAERDRRQVAVVVVDVFDLRRISDTLGRHVGDQVLRESAQHLGQSLREGDVLARIGGHTFAVALADMAHKEDTPAVLARLMAYSPFTLRGEGGDIAINTHVGVALFPRDGASAQSLLHNAELAVHANEVMGLDIAYYSPELTAQNSARFQLERELRHALVRNEMWLAYQPVVDIGTRRVVGVEALLRWDNPQLGTVPPVRFIPVLEETGMIGPVGEWVLEQACRNGLAWRQAGVPPLRIAVNVSVQQLQRAGCIERLLEILRRVGLEPREFPLAIEVTESKLMDNLQHATVLLERLRGNGINVYVDDFGTGYSSLSYLQRLPVDVLKIDRAFVMDIAVDSRAAAMVAAVITLAHGLDMRVVAEGVETEEQLAVLARLGCDHAQGYLFSRPRPAAELAELLRSEHL